MWKELRLIFRTADPARIQMSGGLVSDVAAAGVDYDCIAEKIKPNYEPVLDENEENYGRLKSGLADMVPQSPRLGAWILPMLPWIR